MNTGAQRLPLLSTAAIIYLSKGIPRTIKEATNRQVDSKLRQKDINRQHFHINHLTILIIIVNFAKVFIYLSQQTTTKQ